jgi:hypothetical protein
MDCADENYFLSQRRLQPLFPHRLWCWPNPILPQSKPPAIPASISRKDIPGRPAPIRAPAVPQLARKAKPPATCKRSRKARIRAAPSSRAGISSRARQCASGARTRRKSHCSSAPRRFYPAVTDSSPVTPGLGSQPARNRNAPARPCTCETRCRPSASSSRCSSC